MWNIAFELRSDQFAEAAAGEGCECVVDGDDGVAFANDQAFDGGVGEAAHAHQFLRHSPGL